MALNSRSPLDPRWVTHNVPVESGFQVAEIEIYDPSITESTYDPETNEWESARAVVWSGKARIQPIRQSANRSNMMNPTSIREVQVHIDLRGNTLEEHVGEIVDIRPNYQIVITSSPFDPTMESYLLTVRGAFNTSIPWGKMIHCEVDQEVQIEPSAEV